LSSAQTPNTPDRDPVAEVKSTLDRMDRLLEISRSNTSYGIEKTSSALDGLVADVKSHVAQMQSGLDEFGEATSDTDLHAIAANFEQMVTNYLGVVHTVTSDQERLAYQAMEHSTVIEAASRDLRKTAQQSKLVALNAIVSSERVETGGPLTTIAQHMANLNKDVERENAIISESALRLVEVLATIPQLAAELRGYSEKFGDDFRSRENTTKSALTDFHGRKKAVLGEERERAEHVLRAAAEAARRLRNSRELLEACITKLGDMSKHLHTTYSAFVANMSPQAVSIQRQETKPDIHRKEDP
jgi:hypothetical protein